MAGGDDKRVERHRLWFREQGCELLLEEHDGDWEASFPTRASASYAAGASGRTKLEAAENAVAEYMRHHDLGGGGPALTPP